VAHASNPHIASDKASMGASVMKLNGKQRASGDVAKTPDDFGPLDMNFGPSNTSVIARACTATKAPD
jgi:hypothetical protein